jgi:hypothetical protein
MSDDEHIAVTNTVWVNVIEITKERDEMRASVAALLVLNQDLRAEIERLDQVRLMLIEEREAWKSRAMEATMPGTITMTGEEYDILARERDNFRTYAENWEGRARLEQKDGDEARADVERLRAELETYKGPPPGAGPEYQRGLLAEIERLQRENGALARTYALAEEKLRERTERLNQADANAGPPDRARLDRSTKCLDCGRDYMHGGNGALTDEWHCVECGCTIRIEAKWVDGGLNCPTCPTGTMERTLGKANCC